MARLPRTPRSLLRSHAVVLLIGIAIGVWLGLRVDALTGRDDPGATGPGGGTAPGHGAPAPTAPSSGPTALPSLDPSADAARITDLLAQVPVVATRPQVPGYDRDCGPSDACSFGESWSDDTDAPDGHNGCDTRNDVLREQLSDVAYSRSSPGCDVVAGRLVDPYEGKVMDYATQGAQIHVDHLIPLAAAWDLGAAGWSQAERDRFANDTGVELVAVYSGANLSKGDSTPASWLPPLKAYRCTYVTRYLEAALAYDLPITTADANVIGAVARRC